MTLLWLYDVELNRSHRDLFKSSSYSCSNVKVPMKEIFNHGVTQLKNKILKNFEKFEIPVSVPLVSLAEGCNHLKIQSQPVDHASWPECHTMPALHRGCTAEESSTSIDWIKIEIPVGVPPVPLAEGCNLLKTPKVNQLITHHDLSVIHTYFETEGLL